MAYQGIDYLRSKLWRKQNRVRLRYSYYEMHNRVKDFNIVIPAKWSWLTACLGWCTKSVDAIADREVFREFANDNFRINEIYNMNSRDILFSSAIRNACISSCSFIYISAGEDGYPRLQVLDGDDATGIMDPITYMLQEGYAVLERDPRSKEPTMEAYFTREETVFYRPQRLSWSSCAFMRLFLQEKQVSRWTTWASPAKIRAAQKRSKHLMRI